MTEYILNAAGWEIDKNGNSLFMGHEKVIRCRDCSKWHFMDVDNGFRYGTCDEFKVADSFHTPATIEGGFCAWASERKDGGE